MNLSNPVFVFQILVGFKYCNNKDRCNTIRLIDSLSKMNASITDTLPIMHGVVLELNADLSRAYLLAREVKTQAVRAKAQARRAKSVAIKANFLANKICTNQTKALVIEAEESALAAYNNAISIELVAVNAKSYAKSISIFYKESRNVSKAISAAIKSKSYVDEIFAKTFFSRTNSKTNSVVDAVVISVVNIYGNLQMASALRSSATLQSNKFIYINKSLEEVAEQLNSFRSTHRYLKKRAWDVDLITNIAQGLSEVFPEEWDDWQHWINDMMELRTRMQSKGMNHRLVSLITFYRLFRFALHIGIDKVFILATRRATR